MITLWLYKSVEIVATWLCLQTFQTFLLVLFLKDFFFSLLCAFLKVVGSVGHPIRHIEFKVVDSETSEVLPTGLSGILKVRGPPVMKGYYKVSIIFIVHIPTCVPIYICVCVCIYIHIYACLSIWRLPLSLNLIYTFLVIHEVQIGLGMWVEKYIWEIS